MIRPVAGVLTISESRHNGACQTEKISMQSSSFLEANLRRVRSSQGMTQERLAELSELNVRTVQKIEAGQTNILITTLVRLSKSLETNANEFVDGI